MLDERGLREQRQLTQDAMQELFPRSYAETADWLRRERTAYHDTLIRCEDELMTALQTDPQLMSLAVTCQASLLTIWIACPQGSLHSDSRMLYTWEKAERRMGRSIMASPVILLLRRREGGQRACSAQ